MEVESQVSLDSKLLFGENAAFHPGNPSITSLTPDYVQPQQPVKKPTRQWAAWTREEEESFFTALRQVGKNFEKITRRVQSKNKDQVRHYYYRLVRRMNKLLGPGLCLDAKNSKDTNAAMLRWWSLLEKYSCKASKLHLKPRRFKIFIEALENQLLKDRKKSVRKRPSQLENCTPSAPSTINNQNRAPGHETRTVKLVLMDTQNLQRLGAGKNSLKRNMNISVIRSNRGESAAMIPARQRRKQAGVATSAAYKKWEKAAIAGVSLVADAAEHLEREATDKEFEHDQGITDQKSPDPVEKVMPPLQNHFVETSACVNVKLKLQLFPIDDGTRRALEMDNHNPHLELTLSTRKKISSVLEHLNRKWGNSSIASGELMLFPYSVHRENLIGHQRWNQDSTVSAADVYTSIGSPAVFRLRYGWFSNTEFASVVLQAPSASHSTLGGNMMDMENEKRKITNSLSISELSTNDLSEKYKDQLAIENKSRASSPLSTYAPSEISGCNATGSRNNFIASSDPPAGASWHDKEIGDGVTMKQLDDADDLRLSNGAALSAGEWADSLTNISVGDLLSEVSHAVDPNCIELPITQSGQCLQQIPFSCDSFDAAIAAHMSKHQNKMAFPAAVTSHTSSIWDAEETCDAFIFQKNHATQPEIPTSSVVDSPGVGKQTNSPTSGTFVEQLAGGEEPVDYQTDGDPMDECSPDPQASDSSAKDFTGLTDIYWPESLGPLDLELPSSKYHSDEFILGDSLSGLNRLIASSLDAFQNCSFFGFEKKDSTSIVEARESSSFSDFKIGSQV